MTIPFDEGFDDVYVVTKDLQLSEFRLQPEEVQAVKWAAFEEILSMIDSGAFIPSHIDFISLLFYERLQRDTYKRRCEKNVQNALKLLLRRFFVFFGTCERLLRCQKKV